MIVTNGVADFLYSTDRSSNSCEVMLDIRGVVRSPTLCGRARDLTRYVATGLPVCDRCLRSRYVSSQHTKVVEMVHCLSTGGKAEIGVSRSLEQGDVTQARKYLAGYVAAMERSKKTVLDRLNPSQATLTWRRMHTRFEEMRDDIEIATDDLRASRMIV